MKAAFRILPESIEDTKMHLLAEAGWESISFILFSKAPLIVHGLLMYNIDKNLFAEQIGEEINNTLSNEPVLHQHFETVMLCSNFKESLLIPEKYEDADAGNEMLDLFFEKALDANFYKDKIETKNIINNYRIETPIIKALLQHFSQAEIIHTTSLQLNDLAVATDYLRCIIYHTKIKVLLVKKGQLQLVQYFSYNVALDVVFHLLNVCRQHNVSAEEVQLVISGMVDERSNLYSEIYKYFLQVSFAEQPENITVSANILTHPAHFFSHLIQLVSCVS